MPNLTLILIFTINCTENSFLVSLIRKEQFEDFHLIFGKIVLLNQGRVYFCHHNSFTHSKRINLKRISKTILS
ncbi:hypothetical protein BpHYR1_044374 [Brachionus plicatilis]|uniref:Uncharacterized protein n=1 Tax=Brachionus plicatilis TaxID=10195 RepID=A0A3M7STJ8_BRAPC|nr:hypothetical protein BpHYR1_044374 [Brachionus plicatilis]